MICKCQSSDGTNHANFRQTKSRHGNGISPNKTAMLALFAKYLRSLKITGVHVKASFCERYHSSTGVDEATWLVISLLPILKPKSPALGAAPAVWRWFVPCIILLPFVTAWPLVLLFLFSPASTIALETNKAPTSPQTA